MKNEMEQSKFKITHFVVHERLLPTFGFLTSKIFVVWKMKMKEKLVTIWLLNFPRFIFKWQKV